MDRAPEVFDATTHYLYQDVHNHTELSLRTNTRLVNLNKRQAVLNKLYNRVVVLDMPELREYFYVYSIASRNVCDTFKGLEGWNDLVTACNGDPRYLVVYTQNHLVIPRRDIFANRLNDGRVMIAIRKRTLDALGDGHTGVTLTSIVDPDLANDITIYSSTPQEQGDSGSITTALADPTDGPKATLMVDGFVHPNTYIGQVDPATQYIEAIIDHNVDHDFILDRNDRETFTSTSEGLVKDLLQIPSAMRGDDVYTYDTLSVVIMDKNTQKGVFIPYVWDRSISQITAGVLALSSHLIDSAKEFLETSDFEYRLQVSRFTKDNEIVPSRNRTDILNGLPDDEVMDHLMGRSIPTVQPWTADRLESSGYMQTMIDMDGMTVASDDTYKQQVATLGVPGYAALNAALTLDLGGYHGTLTVNKPTAFKGVDLKPLPIINGLKLHDDHYTYSNTENTVDVDMDTTNLSAETDIHYRYVRTRTPFARIIDTEAEPSVNVPIGEEFNVYQITDGATERFFPTSDDYAEVALLSVAVDGTIGETRTITFLPETTGNTYLLISKDYYAESRWTVTGSDRPSFAFIPQMDVGGQQVPLVKDGNFLVFLNGKYLVECIDYMKRLVVDDEGRIKGVKITVAAGDHMVTGENTVEIYRVDEYQFNRDPNFVMQDHLPVLSKNGVFYDKITTLWIGGKYVKITDVVEEYDRYLLPNALSSGLPYEIRTLVDREFYEWANAYETGDYDQDIADITTHRGASYPFEEMDFVIPRMTSVISHYTMTITNDILDGTLSVQFYNDDSKILVQLAAYESLKQDDLYFNSICIDNRFVQFMPHFLSNLVAATENDRLFIEALIHLNGKYWQRPALSLSGHALIALTHVIIGINSYAKYSIALKNADLTCKLTGTGSTNRPELKLLTNIVIAVALTAKHVDLVDDTSLEDPVS